MPPRRSMRAARRAKPAGHLETRPAENGAVSSIRATDNTITREEYDAQINASLSEDDWRRQIRTYVLTCDWYLQYHTDRSTGSDLGWPDDVYGHRNGRLLFLESKKEAGVLTHDQIAWLDHLAMVRDAGSDIEVYVARPSDRDALWQTLSRWRGEDYGGLHQWCLISVCQRCMAERDNATLIIRGRGGRVVKQIRRAKARGYTA